jgi:hypothetical protein
MRHRFLLICICALYLQLANAQKNLNYLKIHAGAEFTTGLFADGYSTGWGIYFTDYYGVGNTTNILLSTGLASWNAKGESSIKAGASLTRLGIHQFISKGLYLQADGGIGVGFEDWSGTTRFSYGGGPGYLFKSKSGGGFDLSARVNRGFNRTWIGIGAGYQFKL